MNDEPSSTANPVRDAPGGPAAPSPVLDVGHVAERHEALQRELGQVLIGQSETVRLAFLTLACSGHALLEGAPGLGKTLLVRTLAATLGTRFGRVQFTPDLMPSDVIGTTILDRSTQDVRFRAGPLFTDLLLADEINRAPAKTQAALLEAMQERSATVDGTSHPLGRYFTVFATQNPIEQEGTYPLPEAELDRFLFKIIVGYPSEQEERSLLALHHARREGTTVARVLDPEGLDRIRELVAQVIVGDEILAYTTALVRATRDDIHFSLGASPRAGLMLLQAAKGQAALSRRDFVLPEDIQELFRPALRHRILLDPASEVEGLTPDEALERVMRGVAVPR